MVSEGLLKGECYICGISSWREKPLVLRLDHINGIRDDNRLTNLRMLCPNCDSQTDTYCGRNNKNRNNTQERDGDFYVLSCESCGKNMLSRNKKKRFCGVSCQPRKRKFIIDESELRKLVWDVPTTEIARRFGVSDKAVSKRCKALGIEKPSRGSWSGGK